MKYYSTQRPVTPGSFPKSPFNEVLQVVNFDSKTYCEDIGREAWGYIEYKYPLHPEDVEEYELSVIPSKIKEVVFAGLDDFGHRVYKDRDGKLWKYADPGEMPEERHDRLHTSSSNAMDGEPGGPMDPDMDYRIKEAFTQKYWCVTTSINDKGRVVANITNVIEAAQKPDNSFNSTSRRDIYNDWFESQEAAEKFVEEARNA